MALISSDFGIDTERIWDGLGLFGGIDKAVLGRNGRWNFMRNFNRINTQVILMDVSWGGLLNTALNVPQLNTCISTFATMFSNINFKHVDKNGDEIKNSPVMALLNKPNPLQNMRSFLYDFAINNCIYSTNFGYKNYGFSPQYRAATSSTVLPRIIWWLPPGYMKINRQGDAEKLTVLPYRKTDINQIIHNYVLTLDPIPYEPDEIILITEGLSSSGITGSSRIESLQIPLSNAMAAMKSANITYTDMGLRGVLSSDNAKDIDGFTPGDADEMKRMENQFKKDYSLDNPNGHVSFTKSNVKWNPMVFDMQQLQIAEGLEDAFALICSALGLHRTCFPLSHVSPRGMNANTEIDAGLRWTYQNTIIPLGTKLGDSLANDFGITEKEEKLIPDCSWLACMKEDQLAEAQAQQAQATTFQIETQTIVALNNAIKLGQLTQDAAIAILTRDNEYSEDEARAVITIEKADPPPTVLPMAGNQQGNNPPIKKVA